MAIEIIKPGMLTTLQDLGRWGHQKSGMSVSGAMDTLALRMGNYLVGNAETEAALECTLLGPVIRFTEGRLIALTGAYLQPLLDGTPLPMWKQVYVPPGSELSFGSGPAGKGCRAYICVEGGFDVPSILGSKSTCLVAGLGGLEGRALVAGDRIPFGKPAQHLASSKGQTKTATWGIAGGIYPKLHSAQKVIRVMKGPEFERFSDSAIVNFFDTTYAISPESDRMGYRLEGAPLSMKQPGDLLSSAVTYGTIQVPAGGQPILLMADRQTSGGYPRIAQVIRADQTLCAQLQPGDQIRFELASLREAQTLLKAEEQSLARLRAAIALKQNTI